jgi:hypothetical protein
MLRNIGRISDRFPGALNAGTRAQAYTGWGLYWGGMTTGLGADIADKYLGKSDLFPGKGYKDWYDGWKGDTWKAPVGSTW